MYVIQIVVVIVFVASVLIIIVVVLLYLNCLEWLSDINDDDLLAYLQIKITNRFDLGETLLN